jgi:PRTase ComF-like
MLALMDERFGSRSVMMMTITQQTSLRSLRTIEKLPIDYSDDFFCHYPRLKLGVTESAVYYGAQLARVAEDVITQSRPGATDWVVTGPAYHVLPGGPNLLCSYIYEDLRNALPDFITLSLARLQVETEDLEIKDAQSLHSFHNYSTFSHQERNQFYEHSPEPLLEPYEFRGRSILFVNDIKVTGTHQRYMEQAFAKLDPPQICWLYILEIDREIAEAEPEIEYAINQSSIASFEEFADLLATHKLEYTSRCITRLLSYELSQLAELFQMLDAGRKRAILELATAEGRFSGEYFKEKMDLLKRSVGAVETA